MTRKLYLPNALFLLGLLVPGGLAGQSEPTFVQSDQTGPSLGDLARSLRKSKAPPAHTVIDNDNLSRVMDEVESQRLSGKLRFSFNGAGKSFQVSSPDVTCSLSFNAQSTSLLSDPYVPQDLPDSELAKLDGPATINGDTLQVSVYNGTAWNLKEITVGLTILRRLQTNTSYYGSAKLLPAMAETATPAEKHSDLTVLYHLKGSAPPLTTTDFREKLGAVLGSEQEWHWAIVQAKGIPPKAAGN
jgi:hypothetical protein